MKSSGRLSLPEMDSARKVRFELRMNQAENFRKEVCEVYDVLIGSGMEPNEAIRKTRSALKAINYPFATYDVVLARLRASGRLRKAAFKKGGNDSKQ